MKAVAFALAAFAAACAAAAAIRPEEIVWAGRTSDEGPMDWTMSDPSGWRVEADGAEAAFAADAGHALFADATCRLDYRKTGEKDGRVDLFAPKPIDVPDDADTISVWCWGNNSYGRPASNPAVTVHGIFLTGSGRRYIWEFVNVAHTRWCKFYVRIIPYLRGQLGANAKLLGFSVRKIRNPETRFLCLGPTAVFRQELKPISFAARPKRGVSVFDGAPQGANTGEGRLAFPNSPRTVLPAAKSPDPDLEFRLPEDPTDWDSLAVRRKGGEWIRFAVGGGVFPPEAAKTAKISFVRDGDSLVADVVRSEPGVEEVRFGAVEAPEGSVRVPVPYWSYGEKGWTNRPAVVAMKVGARPLFLAATPDWTQSNASEMYVGGGVRGLVANGGVRYVPKTDGRRNGCYERFVWNFSETFEDVLPTIPNPPSPYLARAGRCAWYPQFVEGSATNFAAIVGYWRGLRERGIRHLMASDYGWYFSDRSGVTKVSPFGEGSSTPRLRASDFWGGDAALRRYADILQGELGYQFTPYEDYSDLKAINAFWDPDRVSRNRDGSMQYAWTACYAPKPVWAVAACLEFAPPFKAAYGNRAKYSDVLTCVTPWSRTDYDARVPGAGTFAQTYYAFGELLERSKHVWQGPVYSEGGMHWMYAGLADGNYAQDQEYNLPENPWLVDFDLRRIHPLSCNFGMGDFAMFYVKGLESAPKGQSVDRMLTATAAFGHSVYLWPGYEGAQRSYFLLQGLAAHYAAAKVADIRYVDADGRCHRTSEAILNGVYRRSQVVVRYTDGTVVAANGSLAEPMTVRDGKLVLPPNGFYGRSGDGSAEAFLGEIDGHRAEWARSPEYRYYNGRGKRTRFPDGTEAEGIRVL